MWGIWNQLSICNVFIWLTSDFNCFLQDSSDTLMVEAYIWADQSDPNLFGEWDFEVIYSLVSVVSFSTRIL